MASIFLHDIQRLLLGRISRQSPGVYVRPLTIESKGNTDITLNLFAESPHALEAIHQQDDREFVWLIEAGDPPHYWDGRSRNGYTTNPDDAVRFARFEDAEKVRLHLIDGGVHWKSVQHGFVRPRPAAARSGVAKAGAALQRDHELAVRSTDPE